MKDGTVILGCTSLKEYVDETQRKLGTSIPAKYVSRLYHRDPQEMKEHLLEALKDLPEGTDTVLVSMGFCGGSWEDVRAPYRLVIPRVDDCVSLLLQLGDEVRSNLKEDGHLYVRHKDPSKESFKAIFDHMADSQDLDQETRDKYHKVWQSYYSEIDIMDTGINGSTMPDYEETVRRDAEWLGAALAHVPAGTHLLEKLIKGEWDEQFLVLEPGEPVKKEDMLV